jgi:hypothetical protein
MKKSKPAEHAYEEGNRTGWEEVNQQPTWKTQGICPYGLYGKPSQPNEFDHMVPVN